MSALTVTWMPKPADIERHFETKARQLFELAVRRASKGEYDVDDLKQLALEGHVLIGVAERNGKPSIAAAFEIVRYPKFKVLNIMAIGGSGLRAVAESFFDEVKRFALTIGATHIEASAAPAMSRLLQRKYGFSAIREKLRVAL